MVTLEEKAKIILQVIVQMQGKQGLMEDLCNLILLERLADNTVIKLSQTKKQHLINQYLTLKAELQTIVGSLP